MCFSTFPPLQTSLLRRSTTTTLASPTPFVFHRNHISVFPLSTAFLRPKFPILRLSASFSNLHLHLSTDDDGYNGWGVFESPSPSKKPEGLPKILVVGVGTCVASLLVAVAYFALYRKGMIIFKIPNPLRTLHGFVAPIEAKVDRSETEDSNAATSGENAMKSETKVERMPNTGTFEKLERVKVSIPVDSTQLEALSVLKKLKIIGSQVKADDLCTRREYARWLVHLNSLLERNPKHRILPLKSSSVVAAFDDVSIGDPDFEYIQALAEAGIIPSKLAPGNSSSNGSSSGKSFCFYPERFISRQDLINWKAQLEYVLLPEATEQMSRRKVAFLDAKEISSEVSPEFFIDVLVGDKSITRKVFGQSRRFQPRKPSTKSQAAVALTSGRMAEAVNNELLRMDFENSAREVAMKEIRSELLDKGDIERFWDKKIAEEKVRALEVEKLYTANLQELDHEKMIQVKSIKEYVKEKVVIDCQRKLLVGLKEEVDGMSSRLSAERETYITEKRNLQKSLSKLQSKHESILDKKSILAAKVEAVKILRSWVLDEAKKSQARAKVLEEVGRRWKWHNES